LYLSDRAHHQVCRFDLATRTLDPVVGAPDQAEVRYAEVALAAPTWPASARAALREPRALCGDPGGALVIALADGLVTIPAGLHLRPPEVKKAPPAQTLYALPPGPEAVDAGASLIGTGTRLAPGATVPLLVRTATGSRPAWTWTASAGTLGVRSETGAGSTGLTDTAHFTVPADAAPGSVFRITVETSSSSSTTAPLRAHLELRLEAAPGAL
jgi:hypothetical protein